MWASHADPGDHESEVVGDVKSDLIEGVFGAPTNTFKKARSKNSKERMGREALSRATMDYDKVIPQAAKNAGRWEPLYR